jgi:hypothetical protein
MLPKLVQAGAQVQGHIVERNELYLSVYFWYASVVLLAIRSCDLNL